MALSIPPGQFWGGNNGNWSTFRLILSPSNPQNVNLLPSFLTSQIWVPTLEICNNASVLGTVSTSECYTRRGRPYDPSDSREWKVSGLSTLPISGRPAIFGTDNATIGDPPTITIGREIVAGITTLQPFLGNFGLSAAQTTLPFDTPENATSYGILTDLWKQGLIGSRVWGVNVGASYRGTRASLTLGGYDAARGNDDGGTLTVPMNADAKVNEGDLLVEVRAIGIGGGTPQARFMTGLPVTAVVDSLVPDIYLPASTCAYFEEAFGLVWDGPSRRYFLNETQHQKLVTMNASISIAVGIPGGDGNALKTITLPYAAFDLNLTWPMNGITGPNGTRRYFPLVRTGGGYYLGRVFLQEVYLAADYERRTFNISQAKWPTGGKKDIRMVVSSNTSTVVTPASQKGAGLGSGTIAGIALGVVAVLAVLGLIFWFMRKRRRAEAEKSGRQISRPKNIGSSSFGPRASTRVGTPVEKSPAFTQQAYQDTKFSPTLMTGVSASDTWRTTISGRHELSTPQTVQFASPMPDSARGPPSSWKNPWADDPVELDAAVELPAYQNDRLPSKESSQRYKF
ncbi:uncharacterized protein MYCFIDRAFT_81974 [Pseudocercospora fijiensis CIRAD86]|uniref:Peptidase A1 domain-containing protein n=1 Tax=Pseudocercospora fijiensis (strain CIRAD86) TaxID=383855 RepID=M3B9U2_PSEFD|nr:uncharacterized protein MYCFIDRAFT_81974 [Pseudocercospora fijiensis CIRAD86]EME86028.1 hypothetical protein MYCFIDRAFT_81974 [Pseudocercospora fijiensis CIRAD86]